MFNIYSMLSSIFLTNFLGVLSELGFPAEKFHCQGRLAGNQTLGHIMVMMEIRSVVKIPANTMALLLPLVT